MSLEIIAITNRKSELVGKNKHKKLMRKAEALRIMRYNAETNAFVWACGFINDQGRKILEGTPVKLGEVSAALVDKLFNKELSLRRIAPALFQKERVGLSVVFSEDKVRTSRRKKRSFTRKQQQEMVDQVTKPYLETRFEWEDKNPTQ